jgi:hypothetical protein
MTPRVGVKTTLTMERAFSGLPVPSGSPTFLGLINSPVTRLSPRLHKPKVQVARDHRDSKWA